jgi:hypothetical protein
LVFNEIGFLNYKEELSSKIISYFIEELCIKEFFIKKLEIINKKRTSFLQLKINHNALLELYKKKNLPMLIKPRKIRESNFATSRGPMYTSGFLKKYLPIITTGFYNVFLNFFRLSETSLKALNFLNGICYKIDKDLLNLLYNEKIRKKLAIINDKTPLLYKNLFPVQNEEFSKTISFYNDLNFLETYQNHNLYIINMYDFRLRVYPFGFFPNRTKGDFKFLLVPKKKELISRMGLSVIYQILLNYKIFYTTKKIFKIFLKKNLVIKNNFKHILNYFLEQELEKLPKKKILYISNILKGYYCYVENKKSDCTVALDQVSSGLQIISLEFKIENLAVDSKIFSSLEDFDIHCNILETLFALDEFKKKLKHLQVYLNRKVIKSIIMPKGYLSSNYSGQNKLFNLIKENLKNNKQNLITIYGNLNEGLNKNEIEIIYKKMGKDAELLNKLICDIFDKRYPEFKKNISLFLELIKYYIQNGMETCLFLRTLDGSILKFKYFNIDKKRIYTRHSYDIFYNLYGSINKKKMRTTFLPNYIHSVDGFVARFVTL